MNPAMAENRDATIMYPCILALVDLCHDGIRELLGEKTVIASNISSPICNHTKCTCMHTYILVSITGILIFERTHYALFLVTHIEILMAVN